MKSKPLNPLFKPLNPLLLIGIIGFFTVGSSFFVDIYRAFYGQKDIYWTHQSMKLPLETTENDFQIFIGGKRLQHHLSDNTLFATDTNGEQYPVVSKDITVRLNNWHKVQTGILTQAVFTGVALGATVTMLFVGLFQLIEQKKNNLNSAK